MITRLTYSLLELFYMEFWLESIHLKVMIQKNYKITIMRLILISIYHN